MSDCRFSLPCTAAFRSVPVDRPVPSFGRKCRPGGLVWVLASLIAGATFIPWGHAQGQDQAAGQSTEEPAESDPAPPLLKGIRQLTFAGRRAGEGYFGADGTELVFQSERIADNPFFQIYLMDYELGDIQRISPGYGKTTCAWIHPDKRSILFSSTHDDPACREKQARELSDRAEGKVKRYAFDYDEQYELYVFDRKAKTNRRLTDALGYDAEGSFSPDGKWIAFASNRHVYAKERTEEEAALLQRDKAYFNEIYIMRSDGTGLQRLTDSPGYDGGPFFSPDGSRLCWRRFTPDGAIAEIMTMNIDGTDHRQLTRLGKMSWAPFYHPSGRYLIFTSNLLGFDNFELYLVDVEGSVAPVRVTTTAGFDGLPAFTPDGKTLAWTSNRNAKHQSQIYIADWDHATALRRLGLAPNEGSSVADGAERVSERPADSIREKPASAADTRAAVQAARSAAGDAAAAYRPTDLIRHVDYLCRPELEGRLTGSAGERMATAYVAAYMDHLGLKPAGDAGGWFQSFEFTSGIALADGNQLVAETDSSGNPSVSYPVDQQWRPVAFSATGDFSPAPVVFAGYGIVAGKQDGIAEDNQASVSDYDSFVHLDVKDKWVLCFRFLPEDVSAERRQYLARFSSLRFKAMQMRDRGAKGLVVVSGPRSQVKNQLVGLRFDGSMGGSSIPVLSVSDNVAQQWLAKAGKDLETLQSQLDKGEPMMGFQLPDLTLRATVALQTEKRTGRNVLGVLQLGDTPSQQKIVIGAHVDHLGRGTGGSLAKGDEVNQVHYGADDNASGVAGLLEIAESLADWKRSGKLAGGKRDVIFAAWSGEELGLLGASHFTRTYPVADPVTDPVLAHHGHPGDHSARPHPQAPNPPDPKSHGAAQPDAQPAQGPDHKAAEPAEDATESRSLYPAIAACLNMDMIGRFEKRLVLQGAGSSSIWDSEIERRNVPVGLPIVVQDDCYLPTDASAFFMRGVPILAAFTGSHSEYHTPRDTPDRLNYDATARIARLMGLITRSLVLAEDPPDFISQTRPESQRPRAGLRAYLGSIPDYADTDVKGVRLSGVTKDAPADKAGVQAGDLVVELAGKKIENIYDYTFAIEALKIGQSVKITVERKGQRITLDLTPGSRE